MLGYFLQHICFVFINPGPGSSCTTWLNHMVPRPLFPYSLTVFKSLYAVAYWPWCRLMDPGGSDLESSLPQTENPYLIVEDSQPDSVALEDDPDSGYRAILSRRFSNHQPTSQSPVLVRSHAPPTTAFLALSSVRGFATFFFSPQELIASPSKSRGAEGDYQTEKITSVTEAGMWVLICIKSCLFIIFVHS